MRPGHVEFSESLSAKSVIGAGVELKRQPQICYPKPRIGCGRALGSEEGQDRPQDGHQSL